MINKETGDLDCDSNFAICSVYNSLQARFCQPMMCQGVKAVSVCRRVVDASIAKLCEGDSPIPFRSSDYKLFVVGEFDSLSGRIIPLDSPLDVSLLS
jgi:hypothetical protein